MCASLYLRGLLINLVQPHRLKGKDVFPKTPFKTKIDRIDASDYEVPGVFSLH